MNPNPIALCARYTVGDCVLVGLFPSISAAKRIVGRGYIPDANVSWVEIVDEQGHPVAIRTPWSGWRKPSPL